MITEEPETCRGQVKTRGAGAVVLVWVQGPETRAANLCDVLSDSESEGRMIMSQFKNSEAERKDSFLFCLLFYLNPQRIGCGPP